MTEQPPRGGINENTHLSPPSNNPASNGAKYSFQREQNRENYSRNQGNAMQNQGNAMQNQGNWLGQQQQGNWAGQRRGRWGKGKNNWQQRNRGFGNQGFPQPNPNLNQQGLGYQNQQIQQPMPQCFPTPQETPFQQNQGHQFAQRNQQEQAMVIQPQQNASSNQQSAQNMMQQVNTTNPNTPYTPTVRSGPKFCDVCGKFGHTAIQCWYRQKPQGQQQQQNFPFQTDQKKLIKPLIQII